MEHFKGEKINKETATLKLYFYHDTEVGIEQQSKVEYKKKDLLVHFPRGFDGGDKYRTIKKFSFIGFKGKLPVGVVKSVNFGYGFTKKLNPFAFYINDKYDFDEVVVEKKGSTKIDLKNKKLYLSDSTLQRLHDAFDTIYKKNNLEVKNLLDNVLYELFPSDVDKPEAAYIPNTISTSLASWGHSLEEFSKSDKESILQLFDKLSLTQDFLTNESLSKTKEIVDSKYIKEILESYDELMALVTDGDSLEKRWQEFLKTNSWIFLVITVQNVPPISELLCQ